MSNHYHLLLETPQANLSRGMGWLQNTFTRRINTRHGLWGHLFGGRYKAILVEPGNSFWALLDYIHLNPVRAGIVAEKDGLESYAWSSLLHYLGPSRSRPPWLETATGFEVCGGDDTASGRREFLALLERRVDWRNPRHAGTTFPEGDSRPQLAMYSSLRRGWFLGSERFREELLKMLAQRPTRIEKANGYHGPQLSDYDEKRARALIRAALERFGTDLATLATSSQGRLAQGSSCGDDSEGNDLATGLDCRAVEHGDSGGRLPPSGRGSKTPRDRSQLAEALRSDIVPYVAHEAHSWSWVAFRLLE